MARTNTKEAAEALLRELPSVVGAFVREDINGHPREVHMLVAPGPNPRHLARDVRDLLEERLGVPIDQRVISIAQLAIAPEDLDLDAAEAPAAAAAAPIAPEEFEARLRFDTLETQTRGHTVIVRVSLLLGERVITGESMEVDVGTSRLRAAAGATLHAAALACDHRLRLQLDAVSLVRAFGRDYALVTVLASSTLLGRKPISLAGAQPLQDEPDQAAALAALMAINRVFAKALKGSH